MFHSFDSNMIRGIRMPVRFTYPFHYTPHPLSEMAAREVSSYIALRSDWYDEVSQGKMFGVLVVKNSEGELGYLAAFSGQLAGSYQHDFFVPPIYDLNESDGFFRREEQVIVQINKEIECFQNSKDYLDAKDSYVQSLTVRDVCLSLLKHEMRCAKQRRDLLRVQGADAEQLLQMMEESQFQKAECKRQERRWNEVIAKRSAVLDDFEKKIEQLQQERKQLSAKLQAKLFQQFNFLNALGEQKNITELFASTVQKVPPSGAGECCAPKLLQYAYLNRYQPISMAEFWWGRSSVSEIRRQGNFYPACEGKCRPILSFMLQGLDVENDPILAAPSKNGKIKVVFEDEWLIVVDKPSGMLSVPGKLNVTSALGWVQAYCGNSTEVMAVHRLDMATSGLLVFAKNKDVYKNLQRQFALHQTTKEYMALLDGNVVDDSGEINLPLSPDFNHRPCQKVDYENGKEARSLYEVLDRREDSTLVRFYLLTGRTHQLRVHSAHPSGLNCPIRGDELYGRKSDRLYLHAARLCFKHPVTGKDIALKSERNFL